MNAYIKAQSYHLPQTVVTNDMLVGEFPEWTVEKVASKIGVSRRHVAREDECASDLAVAAAEKLFAEHGIDRTEVDYLLLCTQSPDYFLPTTACLVQDRLGLPTTIGALDFNLGCSGYVYGLSLAKGLICAGIARNVLLITAETYTRHLHPRDKGNRTIFGDAASATLISTEGFALIENFALGTDGRGAENLIVRTGGMRHPQKADDLTFDSAGNPHSSDYLFMAGAEIFGFTLEAVPPLVASVLQRNDLALSDIDLFVFHQANRYMMEFLRKKIGISPERFYYSLENTGNTVSSTIPVALCEARKEHRLQGKILLAGFGVGYSWGATVLDVKP